MGYRELLENFTRDMKIIENDIKNANTSKMMLEKELSWYSSFNYQGEKLYRENLEKSVKNIRNDYNKTKSEKYIVEIKQKSSESRLRSKINPLYWFDDGQISLRKEIKNLQNRKLVLDKEERDLEEILFKKEEEIIAIKKGEDKYLSFDFNQKNEIKNKLQSYIKEKDESLKPLEVNYRRVKDKIKPLVKKIKNMNYELSICLNKINIAKAYDNDLTMANNSYERAMIHNQCKSDLGNSCPQKVLNQMNTQKKWLKSNIGKLDERICKKIKMLSKVINYIVIDGNNLCYNSIGEFIGLDPLVAVANELSKNYDVLVCFDHNIKHLLHCDEKEIKNRFNKKVITHITNGKHQADYTILEFAENKQNSCIISNDRFSDFPDKRVKKENMILTHEIVGGQVIICDLDFSVKY